MALISAEGYGVVGTASMAGTVANLAAGWMTIMGIRGASHDEIFAFWEKALETHKYLDEWEAARANKLRAQAERDNNMPPGTLTNPPPPPTFTGDRSAMDTRVDVHELAAEEAALETGA